MFTTYNNTHVQAGEALNIKSGRDTNLIGAVAQGNTVNMQVGNDLNMESLQDTATSIAKQSNTGVSLSVPIGTGSGSASISQSNQKNNSNYASVYEQTAIRAGEGGFNINVQNNTGLKGAVIDSQANLDKNNLTTGTLTNSDIRNQMDAKASSSGISLNSDMLDSKYATIKGTASNLLNDGKADTSDDSATLSAIAPASIVISNQAEQEQLTGQTAQTTIASLNRDTSNTNRVLEKPDLVALQKEAQQQQADKQLLLTTITTFTDESFKKAFLAKAEMYEVVRDENGNINKDADGKPIMRVLGEAEKLNLKDNGDNKKLNVFTNGIFNDEFAAANYSVQMAEAPVGEKVYLVYFPEANNFLSELLIAAYQKNLEGSTLGLTNASQEIVNLAQAYGQDGLNLINHSRGAITIGNALETLLEMENTQGMLSGTTIKTVGPAYSAQEIANELNTLSGGKQTSVQLQNHVADFVGNLIGGNPATYGSVPEGSSLIKEWIHMFGDAPTAHSCYGTGAASDNCHTTYGKPITINIPPSKPSRQGGLK